MLKVLVILASAAFLSEGLRYDRRFETVYESELYSAGNEANTTYVLYTRKNTQNGVALTPGDKTGLLASGFQGSLPTVMITHGFNDDATAGWMRNAKKEILSVDNVNLITVDWSWCSKNLIYNEVVECMKDVGRQTGKFLRFLHEAGNFNLEKSHLIGHSLGAHLMGFAGRAFPARTIGRITGLDPAGPLFENAEESERLSSSSAKLVDAIHTCRVFLGMKKPIGTIDFYPNGGYNQVGCNNADLRCHHAMSLNYFAKTISKSPYSGKKCQTVDEAIAEKCHGETAVMGYRLEFKTPGIYHVRIS